MNFSSFWFWFLIFVFSSLFIYFLSIVSYFRTISNTSRATIFLTFLSFLHYYYCLIIGFFKWTFTDVLTYVPNQMDPICRTPYSLCLLNDPSGNIEPYNFALILLFSRCASIPIFYSVHLNHLNFLIHLIPATS